MGCTAVIAVTPIGSAATLAATRLQPEAASAWNGYVRATETRIMRELKSPNGFLALDFAHDTASARHTLLSGDLVIEPMSGPALDAPSARVEHWRGAVFIPGSSATRIVDALEQGPPPSEDILRSAVVDRGPGWMEVSMRLRRKAVLTVVYDTKHIVTFTRVSVARDEHEHRDPHRRSGGPGHAAGARGTRSRGSRVSLEAERLLALSGRRGRRDRRMRVDDAEP